MQQKFLRFSIVSVLLIVLIGAAIPTNAQAPFSVYVCVDPLATESRPYLIQFQFESISEMVGLIVPEVAEVTIYTNNPDGVLAGTYSITHHVATGGYQRVAKVDSARTLSEIPVKPNACGTSSGSLGIITPEMLATNPLIISTDFMLVINGRNNEEQLDTQPILGALALHFVSSTISGKNLQIIQLSAQLPKVSFPYLSSSRSTRFVLVTHKEISVRRSFGDDPDVFSAVTQSDPRSIFLKILTNEGLNLFDIMREGNVRIYPQRGLMSEYYPGGFLEFVGVLPGYILREPSPDIGTSIAPITGSGDTFKYLVDGDAVGGYGYLREAFVVRIDGESLWVQIQVDRPEVLVAEPWLVDVSTSHHSDTPNSRPQTFSVFVCVDPIARNDPSYLVQFQLNNASDTMDSDTMGMIVPELADVTVYTDNANGVVIGTFSITHDVESGGYRRQDKLNTGYTRNELPTTQRACGSETEFPDIIPGDMLATNPQRVSAGYALVIDGNTDEERLDTQPILGSYAFHFLSDTVSTGNNLQLLQLSTHMPSVSFPYLSRSQNRSTRFALIANKEVLVSRSFGDDPDDFSAYISSDSRPIFMRMLEYEDLDLFEMMHEGKVLFYPYLGLLTDYQPGGFLKFDVTPDSASRNLPLNEGSRIESITGDDFEVIIKNGANGVREAWPCAIIVNVDNAELWVNDEQQEQEGLVVEPWLIEVVRE